MSIVVFWIENRIETEGREREVRTARHMDFTSTELTQALNFAEALRKKRRDGYNISHVSLQSEMEESVGQAGVSEVDKDYGWSKRRIDPSIKLGRPSGDDIEVDLSDEA